MGGDASGDRLTERWKDWAVDGLVDALHTGNAGAVQAYRQALDWLSIAGCGPAAAYPARTLAA